jgi:uncharacterized membrane protein YfcA
VFAALNGIRSWVLNIRLISYSSGRSDQGDRRLDPFTILLLGILGVFAGVAGGLLGVGGGIFVVPILVLAFNLQAQQAAGTSLVMIMFTALSSTAAYYRQKRIDWRIGISAACVTVPGAIVGAYATQLVSSRNLTIILGAVLFLMAALMMRLSFRTVNGSIEGASRSKDPSTGKLVWKRRIVDSTGRVFEYDARIYSGLALLFIGGLASGFLGLGGGIIVVPILTAYVGLPMHLAVATSMLTMIFTAISGASTHIMLGHVLIDYAAPLVIGILIGAQIGARCARRLKSINLERIFALMVFAMGVLLIITRL